MTLDEAVEALQRLRSRVRPRSGTVILNGGCIRIDHRAAKGAMTVEMMHQLALVVSELQSRDDLGVVTIEGTPGAFCSGGHLGQVREGLMTEGGVMCASMTTVLDALARLPMVVVALVDGPALGGGAEILTAADRRLFSDRATVGFVQARLGISTGWGGSQRLTRLVGPTEALRWLTEARSVTPRREDAFVCDVGDLERRSTELLEHLRGIPVASLRAAKRNVLEARPWVRTSKEYDRFTSLWGGEAHSAAMSGSRAGRDSTTGSASTTMSSKTGTKSS